MKSESRNLIPDRLNIENMLIELEASEDASDDTYPATDRLTRRVLGLEKNRQLYLLWQTAILYIILKPC
jgi:hypothetical protein